MMQQSKANKLIRLAAIAGLAAVGLFVSSTFSSEAGSSRILRSVDPKQDCLPQKGLKPLGSRQDMGKLLEEYGFKTGIEVGVQRGHFSKAVLSDWKSCESYSLVDLWAQQVNYEDIANVDDAKQMAIYEEAKANLEQWKDATHFYKDYSTEAAKLFDDASVDFVYVDARHDYCGVKEDIEAYWSKLRPGGIMAGHDFVDASKTGQNWAKCEDGSIHPEAVVGAVEEFFLSKGITVSVTYQEEFWWSWMVQKPVPCGSM